MARPADRETARYVVERLREGGHQALFAGGCVRDMLLGRRAQDYDVATDATPDEVCALFRRVLLVGAKFGVAMVLHRGRMVEVTTFRSDVSYSDGRRPDAVTFSSPREDAERRDFTVNGMFYDPIAEEVFDYVGGRADLEAGVIRTIGDPRHRFAEDYLRMLRAVRFAVRLGFEIVPETAEAIRRNAGRIRSISGERILDELRKMLAHPDAAGGLRKLESLGLAEQVLPELFEDRAVWERGVARVGQVASERDEVLALGALLSELPPRKLGRMVRRWGGSNEWRDALRWMAQHRDDWRTADELSLAELKRLMANANFERLRALWRVEERRQRGEERQAETLEQRVRAVSPERVSPPPLLGGADLMEHFGLDEGPRLGRVLAELYDAQLNELISTPDEALDLARRLIEPPIEDELV